MVKEAFMEPKALSVRTKLRAALVLQHDHSVPIISIILTGQKRDTVIGYVLLRVTNKSLMGSRCPLLHSAMDLP